MSYRDTKTNDRDPVTGILDAEDFNEFVDDFETLESDFATHNHNTEYLGINAKASDSDKLDNHDSTYFEPANANIQAHVTSAHAPADAEKNVNADWEATSGDAEILNKPTLITDHGALTGLADDDHQQYVKHALSTAENDILVGSGSNTWIKKTLAELKTILGLGSAAYTASTAYEPANANIQSHVSSTSNPHGVTAAQVGAATEAYADAPPYPVTTLPSKILNSDGGQHPHYYASGLIRQTDSGAIGQAFYYYLYKFGNETTFDLSFQRTPEGPVISFYVNGDLITSGYDLYSSGYPSGIVCLDITSLQSQKWHEFKLLITGHNENSIGYVLNAGGAMLR